MVFLAALLTITFIWLLYSGLSYLLDHSSFVKNSWLEDAIDFMGKAGTLLLAWFMFPAIMLIIISLFENKTTKIIEEEEYTLLLNPKKLGFKQEMKLLFRNLGLNILALPLALIPVVNLFAYYWLNAYLIGNSVFLITASRYIGASEAKKMAKTKRIRIMWAGGIVLFFTYTPFLNLFAPILAIAIMVHYMNLKKEEGELLTNA